MDTDLREGNVREALRDRKLAGSWSDRADWEGTEAYHDREKEIYDSFCRRWRELSKPTIALVQGKAIAGALMLICRATRSSPVRTPPSRTTRPASSRTS